MKSYKFYLRYDLSLIGMEEIFATLMITFILQLFINSVLFGVLFTVSCSLLPSVLSYIFASWKFQDSKVTEYFFSLPLPRKQVIFSGFFLSFTAVFIFLSFCSIVETSGLPATVQQYLANTFGGDFYAVPQEADINIIFRIHNFPAYIMIAWISSCFGWLPFLLSGAGLKRIITGIFSYTFSLGLCVLALLMFYYGKFEISFLILSGAAICMSAVFILCVNRFKKKQLFY